MHLPKTKNKDKTLNNDRSRILIMLHNKNASIFFSAVPSRHSHSPTELRLVFLEAIQDALVCALGQSKSWMRVVCAGFAVERSCGSHACAARIRMNRENKKRKIKGFILQIQWKWIQSNAVNVLIQVCWFTSLRYNCCRCELSRIHECARIATTTTINDTIARYNSPATRTTNRSTQQPPRQITFSILFYSMQPHYCDLPQSFHIVFFFFIYFKQTFARSFTRWRRNVW